MTWEQRDLGIIKCLMCKRQFTKKTKDQRFCRTKCRMDYHNKFKIETIHCPKCNEEIDLKQIKENKK